VRRNVIAFLVFAAVVAGGYWWFHGAVNPDGYTTAGDEATRLNYVARVVLDAPPYRRGDIVILEQKFSVGDGFVVSIAQRPLPVLLWRASGWVDVPAPPRGADPVRLERNEFRPMTAVEIAAARIENERLKGTAKPPMPRRPMSRHPRPGEAVAGSPRFAYAHLAVGAKYILLALEDKPVPGMPVWENGFIYWVEQDGTMQCRAGIQRAVLTE
jgi:hypothetical protein